MDTYEDEVAGARGRPSDNALLVFALAASGCGGGSESATATGSGQQNGELSSGSSPDGESALEEDPAVSKLKTPEEKKAAAEAIRHAADANTGSAFKVTDVRVVDGWARVGLEETGVPLEEAVGFSVYLRLPGRRQLGGCHVRDRRVSRGASRCAWRDLRVRAHRMENPGSRGQVRRLFEESGRPPYSRAASTIQPRLRALTTAGCWWRRV